MDYLKKLNPNQLVAAQWNEGPMLVLAGPGSGKTATLTARVARLIEQGRDESFRILCLTFTRKAAAEMRERLLSLVPDAKERALLTTFHSFATDILRQHGSHFNLSPDFEILEDAERVGIVKSVLEGGNLRNLFQQKRRWQQ
ncbi:UvrD-helicase domain-containing protein [Neisseria macacae]|uniref:DNA 3'-5' helicase II n=1 Tax=Neisseria macacae ATCC 33926 TaxID=997348 RepID=A0AA36XKQ7_9NEIS|nr:UvrD-helicase domain-containing protein [Neisseria macacae]EGQ77218.1 ATP-dependent DNA helicase PcrA [Neisseria macacae ATCC 33926]